MAGDFNQSGTSETVGVAVVGGGHWGRNLVRVFADLKALVAVVDSDTQRAAALSEEFGVPQRTFAAVLSDPGIGAVVIATPAISHSSMAKAALLAGKDVFVEKPLSLNPLEADQLTEIALINQRILMVGHLLQYHPAFIKLRDLVNEGKLGQVQYVYSNRLNLGRVRREENILWSFAPHDVSMILALIGTLPERVTALGSYYLNESIADVTTTHLEFAGGQHAHIYVSWLHPFKEQKLVVVGDAGMAVFDDQQPWESKLVIYAHEVRWEEGLPVPYRAEGKKIALKAAEPLRVEASHFLSSVRNRTGPRTDGEEGARVLRVLAAAESSMKKQQRVEVRASDSIPSGESFVHPTAVLDSPCEVGEGSRIWHFSHILSGSVIGKNCTVGQNVMIGPDVVVGDSCKIQNNVSLYKGVELEAEVFCGPSCVFTNVDNPRATIERKDKFRPTLVRRGATIGANATIICGVELGEHCFVGAGSVVTKSVPAFALVVGVPARHIGWVSHEGERLNEDLVCPTSGRRYHQAAHDKLVEID